MTPKNIPEVQNKFKTNIQKLGNFHVDASGIHNVSPTGNLYGNSSINPSGSIISSTNGASNNNPFHININLNLMINQNKKYKRSGNKKGIQEAQDPVKSEFYLLNSMNEKPAKIQKKRTDSMPRLNTFNTIPSPLIYNSNLCQSTRNYQQIHPILSPNNICSKKGFYEKKISKQFFKNKEKEGPKKTILINNHLALVTLSDRSNSTKKVTFQKYGENRPLKSNLKRDYIPYKSTTKLRPSTLKGNLLGMFK